MDMVNKNEQITAELEGYIKNAEKSPFAGKLIAPLRLVYVWIKNINEIVLSFHNRLAEIEQSGK